MLFTSFVHKRERCYQRRRCKIVILYGESEGNTVCVREHHPMVHLLKSNYCSAKTLLTSLTPRLACIKRALNQVELGRPAMVGKTSSSLFAVVNIPVKAVGGVQSKAALMMEDNSSTEKFDMHALAEKLNLFRTPATVLTTAIGGE